MSTFPDQHEAPMSFREHRARVAANTAGTLSELQRANSSLSARNERLNERNAKLSAMLRSSRDKLSNLYQQIEDMAEPPSTYGTFLARAADGRSAEIITAGRRMRVAVSPMVCQGDLVPGAQVRLGQGHQILDADGATTTGEVVMVLETLGHDRVLVTDPTGTQRVVLLAGPLRDQTSPSPRAGDQLLVEPRAQIAVEIIPKAEAAKLALEEVPDVSYADIGGLDQQIGQIRDAIELPFAHPELYRAYDLTPPKGVLLYGPPGCGKTLIAKAVANSLAKRSAARLDSTAERASYFLNIKGPELLSKYVGESERQIRVIFERARELADDGCPVIVFFDEMDSLFRTRGSGKSSDVETTIVPQLLSELDGVENLDNVIVIGATNREELIDPAILRPGRLDVKIRVQRPGKEASRDIFSRYLKDGRTPLAAPARELIDAAVTELFSSRPFVELRFADGTSEVLDDSAFISGAMIANIVDRAKKLAIKDHLSGRSDAGITALHLNEAIAHERAESEDLPDTSNPQEWARIVGGRWGHRRAVEVRVLAHGAAPTID